MSHDRALPPQPTEVVLTLAREELTVGRRVAPTGSGVRIHKTVSEQTRRIDMELLRDALSVTRVAVDKVVPLSEAPAPREEGNVLIVPVLEEILVMDKRVRIKEEIHITRSVRHELYSTTVVLRTEDVVVERFGDCPDTDVKPTEGGQSCRHS
jgi:uncharacterized protein (TIGR02271 family)